MDEPCEFEMIDKKKRNKSKREREQRTGNVAVSHAIAKQGLPSIRNITILKEIS